VAEAERHLELALKYPEEGRALADRDPALASEKLYRAAEEAVKALAAALELPEAREAAERGRWSSQLLLDAADSAAAKLGAAELPLWWRAAWVLHVEGFHEARLSGERVKKDSRYVEALVDLARRTLLGGFEAQPRASRQRQYERSAPLAGAENAGADRSCCGMGIRKL